MPYLQKHYHWGMSLIVLRDKKCVLNEAVHNRLGMILIVPDHFWMKEMCNEIMRTMPNAFHQIPNCFKTQKMCDQAVKEDSYSLQFVPDWFLTRECMWMWYDDHYDDGGHWDEDTDEDNFFDWCKGHQKWKTQKASIKEELLPIA